VYFCSISNIAIFSKGHVDLALFWMNMHARNVSSYDFQIKLMVENGP
jgi:hypothetical protein